MPGVKQQKAGGASVLPAAVIADDDDALLAIDYGRADPFGAFEAVQAGNRDLAGRLIGLTAPEPELELHRLAGDRTKIKEK